MPVILPSAAAVRAVGRRATSVTTTTAALRQHPLALAGQRRAASSHGSQYDPPTGWLFGVRPGEKYQREGWENMFFYGFCGSLAVFAVAYAFKPDTSIQTWALEEARRRLEAEGILEEPQKKL